MVGLIVGAALLGIIIAVMEGDGEFPGRWNMLLCVLATAIPTGLINAILPDALFSVGAIVGASGGGFVISARCGMSHKRSAIAAGIWLASTTGISWLFRLVL